MKTAYEIPRFESFPIRVMHVYASNKGDTLSCKSVGPLRDPNSLMQKLLFKAWLKQPSNNTWKLQKFVNLIHVQIEGVEIYRRRTLKNPRRLLGKGAWMRFVYCSWVIYWPTKNGGKSHRMFGWKCIHEDITIFMKLLMDEVLHFGQCKLVKVCSINPWTASGCKSWTQRNLSG